MLNNIPSIKYVFIPKITCSKLTDTNIPVTKNVYIPPTLDDVIKTSHSLECLNNVNNNIIGGKFHTHTHILYDIRTLLGPKIVTFTEIGSFIGSSACLMLQHPYETNIVCIDPLNIKKNGHPFLNKDQFLMFNENIEKMNKYNRSVTIHRNYSTDLKLLKQLNDDNFKTDILFIDGDHSFNGVISDFTNYKKFVNTGGYIIFDDYNDHCYSPDVCKAVNSIVSKFTNFYIIGDLPNYQNATPILTPNNKSNEFILEKL